MTSFSRRELANFAVEEILAGKSTADLAKSLAAALLVSKKQKQWQLLLSDIDQQLEDRGLLGKARVTSAHKLSNKLQTELETKLKKSVDLKDVVIIEEIDKSVIGGLKVETANHSWDNTIIRQLNDFKGAL